MASCLRDRQTDSVNIELKGMSFTYLWYKQLTDTHWYCKCVVIMDIFLRLWKTDYKEVGSHTAGVNCCIMECHVYVDPLLEGSILCGPPRHWRVLSSHGMSYNLFHTHILRVQDGVLLNDHISCCLAKKLEDTSAILFRLELLLIIFITNSSASYSQMSENSK